MSIQYPVLGFKFRPFERDSPPITTRSGLSPTLPINCFCRSERGMSYIKNLASYDKSIQLGSSTNE